MTVEDLTRLHPYMEYLCGRSGGGAEISYIDIVEIPEGSVWTSAGDFIITTGYFLQTDGDFERLVHQLIENRVVGLGVKIKKYVQDIPPAVREYAEAHHFPILSIPLELSYREIQGYAAQLKDSSRSISSLCNRGDIADFYMEALFHNHPGQTFLRELSETTGIPFQAVRLVLCAAMDPVSAQRAIDQLLQRPSPEFFLMYDNKLQYMLGVLSLRPGLQTAQAYLYGQRLLERYCPQSRPLSISEPCSAADQLCAAYRHSRFALELGRVIHPKKPVYRYLDYIEYDFIRENLSSATLERLAEEYLSPLLDYDSQKSAGLVKTLSVLDNCAYNIQQTSAALGIHRNTLYDRTRKIGELLGHSLDAKLTRDAIHLALVFFTLKQLP